MNDNSIMHSPYMQEAIEQAKLAASCDEVPVGAVLVNRASGEIIARAHNLVESDNDPTAHAEILVIRQAALLLGSPRLPQCDLYVTLEPCAMCAQAIAFARINAIYYGASDVKGGAVDNGVRIFNSASCHHKPAIYGGIADQQCGDLLRNFFASKR